MTLKETLKSWIYEKELTPEEIENNINEVEDYLKKFPKELFLEYKKETGKDRISIFHKQWYNNNMRYDDQLFADITDDNNINLHLHTWGEHKGWTHSNREVWENPKEYYWVSVWKENISQYKKDIFKLEEKLRKKIRNQKIIAPVKNKIKSIFKAAKPKNTAPERV